MVDTSRERGGREGERERERERREATDQSSH